VCVPLDGADASRDFAFVEFQSVDEAVEWVEGRRGDVSIDGSAIKLAYSRRDAHDARPKTGDWICVQVRIRLGLSMTGVGGGTRVV
jgi:hypothetical protein